MTISTSGSSKPPTTAGRFQPRSITTATGTFFRDDGGIEAADVPNGVQSQSMRPIQVPSCIETAEDEEWTPDSVNPIIWTDEREASTYDAAMFALSAYQKCLYP